MNVGLDGRRPFFSIPHLKHEGARLPARIISIDGEPIRCAERRSCEILASRGDELGSGSRAGPGDEVVALVELRIPRDVRGVITTFRVQPEEDGSGHGLPVIPLAEERDDVSRACSFDTMTRTESGLRLA